MADCPECGIALHNPKACKCGWKKYEAEAHVECWQRCDYCRESLRYFGIKETHGGQNRIIGRSIGGGYVCRDCYERRNDREFNWLDARIERLYTDHADDHIGVMLRAAHGKQTREQRSELIGWMKDAIRGFGKLPYDKQKREVA